MYTDPVQHVTTADKDLGALSVDLSVDDLSVDDLSACDYL